MRMEDPPEVSRRLGAGFFATSNHPLGRVDSGLLAFGLRLGPAFRCGSVSRFAGLLGRPSRALAACLLLLVTAGCEEAIAPPPDLGAYFTLWGALDPSADDH